MSKDEYKLSEERPINLKKEWYLISAIIETLKELNIPFKPLYKIFNFKNKTGSQKADFLINNLILLEAKNWMCMNYWVGTGKAYREIVERFIDVNNPEFGNIKKILVISRPEWREGAKSYLESNGILVIELGYFVDENTWEKTVDDLKQVFSNPDIKEILKETSYTNTPVNTNTLTNTLINTLTNTYPKVFVQSKNHIDWFSRLLFLHNLHLDDFSGT